MSEARASHKAQGRVGTVINGKWQVDARIGAGGMATVYSATHRNGHRAALKMLHGQLSRDPATRARFLREGYVANAVGHPGVVAVLDDGVAEDGAAFLVLELLEGETIDARRVRLGGALPVDEALDLADQALDALAAAHEKGIVHRDVKPENVFLTNEGQIKLLDFGLARMKDAHTEATQTGVTIGTPEFMPPEQAMGRRDAVDARSDVWGLGATLYTAITGRYVHDDAQSLHEQLIASATRRSNPIRELAPHVSPACANVIDRALELEMDDRWQSAREMQAALRAARGPRADVFTADSMTVPAASLPPSSPFSLDKPLSSDKTMHMPAAPARPPADPLRKMHDATDMEATFVEATHAAPIGSLPSPRLLGSAPGAPPDIPGTARMRGSMPSYPSPPPGTSRASAPPPGPGQFRQPLQTPSADHATIPAVSPGPFPASQPPHLQNQGPIQAYGNGHAPSVRPRAMSHHFDGPMSSPMSSPHGLPPPPPKQGSGRIVILVSIVLILVCAAMGAYVLWHGSHSPVR